MTEAIVSTGALPEMEFWFEFGSNYSYPSVMRIEAEAQRRGVRIVHHFSSATARRAGNSTPLKSSRRQGVDVLRMRAALRLGCVRRRRSA
jgi:2-hydroxychromene-2-carboxylate isomerase